jgi:hypothetical protein
MAHIHLIVHVMHEFVPKSALIVLKGLGFKRQCHSSTVNIDRMVSLPQSRSFIFYSRLVLLQEASM